MARILSILTLVYFLFTLGDFHKPADITGPEIVIGFTFWPVGLISVLLLFYGVAMLGDGKNRSHYVAIALCALPMSLRLGVGVFGEWQRSHHAHQVNEWAPKADKLAAVLYQYSQQHPERFHPIPGTDEEVSVEGFVSFSESQPEFKTLGMRHSSEEFLDFTGRPVHYYLSMNDKGLLNNRSRGELHGADWQWRPYARGCVGIADSEGYYLASAP